MAAGFASLTKLKQNARVMAVLQTRAQRLVDGMSKVAKEQGILMQTAVRGSMFGFFFNENPVKNFDDATKTNAEIFAAFHSGMLDEGFYFACSLYETGFISTAITDEMIEETINAAERVFKAMKSA